MAEDFPAYPNIGFLVSIGLAFTFVLVVTIFLLIKYAERKRIAALTLAGSFSWYALSALCVFIGALLQYVFNPAPLEEVVQYSRYGFNLGYIFSAVSNIYLVLFVSQIFSQTSFFRKTGKMLPLINAILNGITIGLVIDAFQTSPYNPAYGLIPTIYHLVLTFIAFGLLLGFSIDARRDATYRWEKAGFTFIIGSALSGIMIYLMLALDRIATLAIAGFEEGYTPFVYIGWTFAILMSTLAYAGYVMPEGLRKWFSKQEVK